MSVKINTVPNCDNAPKKEFLRDFNIAFAEGNIEFILKHIHDDIVWNIYGDQTIEGKEAFRKAITEMANYTAQELSIHQFITHGKSASTNGEMVMKGGKKYAFCDIYEFVSAGKNIIKQMDSYVVETT